MNRFPLSVGVRTVAAVIPFALAATSLGQTITPATKSAAQIITEANLRASLTFIASDALQGRDTPSQGLDAAAEFLAYNLRRFGVRPAGDHGTYFQRIRLEKRTYPATTQVQIAGQTFVVDKDFVVMSGQASQTAPIVYAPDGIAKHDVRGKIVLLEKQATNAEEKLAVRNGAIAILRDSGFDTQAFAGFVVGYRFGSGFHPVGAEERGPQVASAMISSDMFRALSKAGADATISATPTVEHRFTQNVVGLLDGSDPKLRSEYVAFGAHYDHLGMDPNLKGDQIYNGADDDGSGTVSVLGIAEAASRMPHRPRRSLLFVWHCGEEKGLWGSEYFTEHPTVPIGRVVTQLNIDMVGRSKRKGDTNPRNRSLTGPDSVYVIGTTMMSTRLGKIVHGVNGKFLKLGYDTRYDSPTDPNHFFERSDHYNYAHHGVPICFWFDGEHEDYHQVSDEVSKIDFRKMARIAQTVFITGITVANEAKRPAVDKPLARE